MGNCAGSAHYIAKETFHPAEDAFHDLPPQPDDPDAAKHADQLKIEKPLKITLDEKLKMLIEETGLLGPGGVRLYKMKNLTSGQTGLVMADTVAQFGTVECEK